MGQLMPTKLERRCPGLPAVMFRQDNTPSRRCSMTTKSRITRESTGLSTATPPQKWTDYVRGTGPGLGEHGLERYGRSHRFNRRGCQVRLLAHVGLGLCARPTD